MAFKQKQKDDKKKLEEAKAKASQKGPMGTPNSNYVHVLAVVARAPSGPAYRPATTERCRAGLQASHYKSYMPYIYIVLTLTKLMSTD